MISEQEQLRILKNFTLQEIFDQLKGNMVASDSPMTLPDSQQVKVIEAVKPILVDPLDQLISANSQLQVKLD